ncbi:hypothetical protein N0V94_007999 [Neodidymelliopsis sp. IMI 364377]|nr:hypothetical protein N0V94_007999 [Neodidymelliopsis sp. IMI 364377]
MSNMLIPPSPADNLPQDSVPQLSVAEDVDADIDDGEFHIVQSDGLSNQPLRNTLAAFWAERLPIGFKGTYGEICFDVTGDGIKSEQLPGSTSRYNTTEADHMAYWIMEQLEYVPPADTADKQYTRIRGTDICASTNYTSQVSTIRRELLELAESKTEYIRQEVRSVQVISEMAISVHGNERPIYFYCTVITVGHSRLEDHKFLPIDFVANNDTFATLLNRRRLARYIFGAFKLFALVKHDRRKFTYKYRGFFAYVSYVKASGLVMTLEHAQLWMENRQKPENKGNFTYQLHKMMTYDEPLMEKPKWQNASGLHGAYTGVRTTADGSKRAYRKAPAGMVFGGKRDKDGNLLDTGREVYKKTRGGRRRGGRKFEGDNHGPGGKHGAAGAA